MKSSWQILLLLAVTAALYVVYPTRTHECDAVIYSSAALQGVREMTFYPGHLGFGPLVAVAAGVGRRAAPPLNPIWLLQYLSMAAGLAGMYAFYRALVQLGVGRGRAALFAAIVGYTYGYWHYALQAESHILSTAFLLFFLWQFCRVTTSPSPGTAAWAGVLLGLATLMHQKNIVLVLPALIGLAVAVREGRRLTTVAGTFVAAYIAVAILPYLVVAGGVLGLRTAGDLNQWIRGVSATSSAWGQWSRRTLPAAGIGVVRSIVGSHFVLGLGPVKALAVRMFPHASLQDELAIASSVGPAVRAVLLLLEAAVLVLALTALARRGRNPGALLGRNAPLMAFLAAWILFHGVFAAWWAPERAEFWMDLFPPVVMLLAVPLDAGRERQPGRARLAGAFLLAMAGANFLGSIRPQSLATTDAETNIAIALDVTVKPGAAVLADIPFRGRASVYAAAFTKVDLLSKYRAAPNSALEARLRLVDSLLTVADSTRRGVYLVVTPLASGEANRVAYRELVSAMATRFRIDEVVPIRANIDLRRITRRQSAPP